MATKENTRRGGRGKSESTGKRRPAAAIASVGFEELGLEDWLLRSVASLDLGSPTQLQAEMIPLALRGEDCIVGASAGAGKTAAYGLPLLQRVKLDHGLQAMVIVPTKELAARVHARMRRMSGEREYRIITAFPARDRRGMESPEPAFTEGEILVGTPGRILDLIERGAIDLNNLRLVVLEEFDRMLAMDLLERVQRVLQNLPADRQTIVLADRLDADVREAALPLLREPREIRIAESEQCSPLEYRAIDIGDASRMPALLGFLEAERPRRVLILAASEHEARSTIHTLRDAGYRTETLGERAPRREFGRERRPRGGACIHVDARLSARGQDLANLSHIVYLHAPRETVEFAQQMNRIGRLMQDGVIVLFAADEELETFQSLNTALGVELNPVTPEWVHGPKGGPIAEGDHEDATSPPARAERGRSEDGGRRERGGRSRGGERRERSGRGGSSRSSSAAKSITTAGPPPQNRFTQALRRDEALEARGIMPIPRTLGSRFKPAGRSRKSK